MLSEVGNKNGEDTQRSPEAISTNNFSGNQSPPTIDNVQDNAFGTDISSSGESEGKEEISKSLNNVSTTTNDVSENGDSQMYRQEKSKQTINVESETQVPKCERINCKQEENICELKEKPIKLEKQNSKTAMSLQCAETIMHKEILGDVHSQMSSQLMFLREKQNIVNMPDSNFKNRLGCCSSMVLDNIENKDEGNCLGQKDSTCEVKNTSNHDESGKTSLDFKESLKIHVRIKDDYDNTDGAVSLPLKNSVIVPNEMPSNDIVVTLDCNKPFKPPSLTNLFNPVEAQSAELEENARALSDVSVSHEQYDVGENCLEIRSSHSSDASNSDTESQQASYLRSRGKKV